MSVATPIGVKERTREKPILMSGPMVRAILEGRKSQTRRVVKPQPPAETHYYVDINDANQWEPAALDETMGFDYATGDAVCCPYGKPGVRLLCYNCFYGSTDNTQADSGITERRLHGRVGRADLQPHALRGIRTQGASGLVSTERAGRQKEGETDLLDSDSLSRKQEGDNGGSPSGLHGLSRNATQGQTGDAAQEWRQEQQQTDESAVGDGSRELAGQEGSRNRNGGRESLGGEVHQRGASASSVGNSEGIVQSETGRACAQCQSIVDKRYRSSGTYLYVKETFYAYGHFQYTGRLTDSGKREIEFVDLTQRSNLTYFYSADSPAIKTQPNKFDVGWHKRPSIFLPGHACRLTLGITDVRVERLQEITEADAIAEGIQEYDNGTFGMDDPQACMGPNARQAFWRGWDVLNAKRGYPWESNPWVWVIGFKKL